ncbi:MAG: hypothetical protein DHS20C01_06400 [marine bacterium B5-7]|nr:MAG: hypothetical protein DHS20C01_06400 [marine bacterium B5-7]
MALLLVLLSLALLTTATVYLVEDNHLAIRRTGNQAQRLQAQYLSQSALQWAMLVLQKDGESSVIDHLGEPWTRLTTPIRVEQGELAIEITDAQGRFNINNLQIDETGVWTAAFKRLLKMNALDESLADKVRDWLDTDIMPISLDGAEDSDYLLKDPPYRAANNLIADPGELRLIDGFTKDVIDKLRPYIAALPESGVRININTCPESLFRIFGQTLLPDGAGSTLADSRGETGYEKPGDFLVNTVLASHADVAEALSTVSSDYFTVLITSRYGRISRKERYLVRRQLGQVVIVSVVRLTSVA